ncbi:MAG: BspA family leucine-rich repeat surface protein, partial [Clostridia bacterium]|nr:BspA family leucine-rich repeat surface protein [Clostridia bacterium]
MNTTFKKNCLILTSIIIAIAFVLAGAFIFASPTTAYAQVDDPVVLADGDCGFGNHIFDESTKRCSVCDRDLDLYWGVDGSALTLSSDITNPATPNKCTAIWWDADITSVTVDTYAYAGQSTSEWFYNCDQLWSVDLSKLDTSDVADMSSMFDGCNGLTSLDVSNFDTSKVTNMSYMFEHCNGLTSLDVSNFATSKVTNMSYMFESCGGLTSLDLSAFNTESVTNMAGMFSACASLTSLDVTNFDTSNVTNMNAMFHSCETLTSLDVTYFDTSNVNNMALMFNWCSSLTSLDLSNFNTSNVTTMSGMFNCCSNLTSLDVSNFNTSSVMDMSGMFAVCSGLISLDLSNFNTAGVKDMESMFYGCSGLTSLDLSNLDTSNVVDMKFMFDGCGDLTSLDMHSFNTSSVTDAEFMFEGCNNLDEIRAPQTIGAEPLSFPHNDDRWWNDTRKIEITQYITSDDAGHTLYLHNAHKYGDLKNQVDANCTQTGVKEHKDCTICKRHFDFFGNEIENLTIAIDPDIHVWDVWNRVVTTQPTCTEKGEAILTCTLNSSHTMIIPIDMLEHQYEMGGHCKNCEAQAELYWGVEDGVLTLSSYQTYDTSNKYPDSKWDTDITSVTVDTYAYAGHSTANWFFNCGQLTSVDLNNLDTSDVEDMSDMFVLCNAP